ncbi:seminal plasma protein HSP-1-like [Equus przewalskii]|nr:PREDICTED: seminal plasma protein HSP-1-like [Equus przewalskii]
MAPRLGIFLILAGTCIFLQLDHVDGDKQPITTTLSATMKPDYKCAFPFNYRGKWYFDCTRADSFFKWCSLNEDYSGKWKYCVDDDYAKCVFPFVYRGQTYNRCTTDGSLFWISWCSVTTSYDRDGAWRYCYNTILNCCTVHLTHGHECNEAFEICMKKIKKSQA